MARATELGQLRDVLGSGLRGGVAAMVYNLVTVRARRRHLEQRSGHAGERWIYAGGVSQEAPGTRTLTMGTAGKRTEALVPRG